MAGFLKPFLTYCSAHYTVSYGATINELYIEKGMKEEVVVYLNVSFQYSHAKSEDKRGKVCITYH